MTHTRQFRSFLYSMCPHPCKQKKATGVVMPSAGRITMAKWFCQLPLSEIFWRSLNPYVGPYVCTSCATLLMIQWLYILVQRQYLCPFSTRNYQEVLSEIQDNIHEFPLTLPLTLLFNTAFNLLSFATNNLNQYRNEPLSLQKLQF